MNALITCRSKTAVPQLYSLEKFPLTFLIGVLTLAPARMRTLTTSSCPFLLAQQTAVSLFYKLNNVHCNIIIAAINRHEQPQFSFFSPHQPGWDQPHRPVAPEPHPQYQPCTLPRMTARVKGIIVTNVNCL